MIALPRKRRTEFGLQVQQLQERETGARAPVIVGAEI